MNKNIKVLTIDNIEGIIQKLQTFYEPKKVELWGHKIVKKINLVFKKYQIIKFSINKNSYMGIVMDCVSLTHGSIYIKVVPPMINRFENEIRTLKYLPDNLTCKFYEIDYKNKILVMDKIMPGTLVEFYPNQKILKNLFAELYKEKIEINASIREYTDFYHVLLHDYKILNSNHLSNKKIDKLFNLFTE